MKEFAILALTSALLVVTVSCASTSESARTNSVVRMPPGVFVAADSNDDGIVHLKELDTVLDKEYEALPSPRATREEYRTAVKALFKKYDTNGDDALSEQERRKIPK